MPVPLTDLTSKRGPQHVTWNAETEVAFHKLKDLLMETPVLGVADPSRSYVLHTDASEQGLGAVLSQADCQGEEHLIAYASQKLLPRETKYSTIEKEYLAIVWPLKSSMFTSMTSHLGFNNPTILSDDGTSSRNR